MIWACELKSPRHMSIYAMTAVTDTSTPHSEGNLDSTDVHKMLEGLGASKQDSTKLQNECGSWNILMHESMEELKITLRKLNFNRKTMYSLILAKHKVIFGHVSMHNIANMRMSLDEQTKCINSIENGGYVLPSIMRAEFKTVQTQNMCFT